MHRMRPQVAPGGPDHAVAVLAARQYGVVTHAQLIRCGLSARAIARRVAAGRLHPLYRGVYAVGHRSPRRETTWVAATFACGDGAALSHRSAATLWRISDGEGPRPDVTVPTRNQRGHPDIHIHRPRRAVDITRRHGIRVTTPAETLVDLAHELDAHQTRRALREAQFLRLFDLAATQAALGRRPSKHLNALIADLVLAQTDIEDRLLDLCDRHRLPRPRTQQPLLGRSVDFLWPAERVVVETDGWEAHGTRDAFQADRAATNAFQLAGYTVLRFTSADVRRRARRTATQIRRALAQSRR
jgi:very-short-patch-repair endonuclease